MDVFYRVFIKSGYIVKNKTFHSILLLINNNYFQHDFHAKRECVLDEEYRFKPNARMYNQSVS